MECLFQIRQVQNPLIWEGISCLYRSRSPPSQTALTQEIVTFREKKAQNNSQVQAQKIYFLLLALILSQVDSWNLRNHPKEAE